jgi:DNA modification methylase
MIVRPDVAVMQGDVLGWLPRLPAASVQCCVTSPPYWGLRDYGLPGSAWPGMSQFVPLPGMPPVEVMPWFGCLGLEPDPMTFVAHIVHVFREVRRVLKDDGTLWLNLGDSYARPLAKGATGTPNGRNLAEMGYTGAKPVPDGLKPKDLIGIPWRVAFALQADGWYLRSDVVWAKPNPMPESVTDRPTKAHEYVFLLAKSERYAYDADAIKETSITNDARRPYMSKGAKDLDGRSAVLWRGGQLREINVDVTKRNARTVWTITPKPFKGAHFATFPPELARRCILAGSQPGDLVLDPFNGAGTTGIVTSELGRRYCGIELNPAYVELTRQRFAAVTP